MTYRAKTALSCLDHETPVSGLRGPLRQLAAHEGTTPDWSTLRVTGPEEVVGRYGVSSSEWTATVKNPEEPAGYL